MLLQPSVIYCKLKGIKVSLQTVLPLFMLLKCYIISCLFHEIKLWPLNWLILESKSYSETFSSESVRFLFELTVVQSLVNTAVKWKKNPWLLAWFSQYYLTGSSKLHEDFQRGQVRVIWPCIRYTGKKKIKNKNIWNNVKCKLLLQLVFSVMAEIKYCQENKKESWTGCISAQATIQHFSDEQLFKIFMSA